MSNFAGDGYLSHLKLRKKMEFLIVLGVCFPSVQKRYLDGF